MYDNSIKLKGEHTCSIKGCRESICLILHTIQSIKGHHCIINCPASAAIEEELLELSLKGAKIVRYRDNLFIDSNHIDESLGLETILNRQLRKKQYKRSSILEALRYIKWCGGRGRLNRSGEIQVIKEPRAREDTYNAFCPMADSTEVLLYIFAAILMDIPMRITHSSGRNTRVLVKGIQEKGVNMRFSKNALVINEKNLKNTTNKKAANVEISHKNDIIEPIDVMADTMNCGGTAVTLEGHIIKEYSEFFNWIINMSGETNEENNFCRKKQE